MTTTTLSGVYRDGQVVLNDVPNDVPDGTRVIVTFVTSGPVDLAARGVGREQAADLRARLRTFAEDWDQPEMDAYDDYDAHATGAAR